MSVVDAIRAKRDGRELAAEQVDALVGGYLAGQVSDGQMAALLMAVCLRGMAPAELERWTSALAGSGRRLDLSGLGRPAVDKHSTGGVGDKVSLVVVPLVAACGAAVPHVAGRGLGHTGGTVDKLAAIPGWRGSLEPEEIVGQLGDVGAVICAAGAALAPADARTYALRDVTGTVESTPLIASSVIAKKAAAGVGALVLDVKVGSGALLHDVGTARELARTLVRLGTSRGIRTVALLTGMSTPLGEAVGNAVEVAEAVEVLCGGGPRDLREVCVAVAREMLAVAALPDPPDPEVVLAEGRAHAVWRAMVRAQGGDPDADLPEPAHREIVVAPRSGVLTRLDAYAVGLAAWRLGAGRARLDDAVSPVAGVLCLAKEGDEVGAGEPLFELHCDEVSRVAAARAALAGGVEIGDQEPVEPPVVLERIAG